MKIRTGTAATLAVSALLAAGSAYADQSDKHIAQSLEHAKLSLIEAIRAAEKEGGGHAIQAEYDFERGNPAYYAVKILSSDGKKLTKYELDPASGKVLKTDDEGLERYLTFLKPASIEHAPTSLTHAIYTAQSHFGGRASEAEIERGGDEVKYSVKVVKLSGATETVHINGSDGKIDSAK